MKDRSRLYSIFKSFYNEIKTKFNVSICLFRSNNARENFHSSLSSFFDDHGIIDQSSCARTPQQNGVTEHKMRHLLEVTVLSPFIHMFLSPIGVMWLSLSVTL